MPGTQGGAGGNRPRHATPRGAALGMVLGSQPQKLPSLSIVLPAFNEAENIEEAVSRAVEAGESSAEKFEVLVVDDGSVDETSALVAGLAQQDDRIRALSHNGNQGYGAAIRSGFAHARHAFIFYSDADNQFDLTELRYFVPLMARADVAAGFRAYRYDPPYRLFVSWIYNLLVRIVFRVHIRDVDCAFKLFRREVIDQITIETSDFFVDTELIAKARRWNFEVVEKGVRHFPRAAGETTVSAGDIPRTLRTIAIMWKRIYLPSRADIERIAAIKEAAPTLASPVEAPRAETSS
jgi:dolichol-phosphate mannosyltransferase